jgi:hypothetical protein
LLILIIFVKIEFYSYLKHYILNLGARSSIVGREKYATDRKVAGSIPDEVIAYFSIDLIVPAALWPGVDSTSNRNECQESSCGGKSRLTTSLSSVIRLCRKYGSLDV